MPNIAKLLKDEIERLARKEVKAAVLPLQRDKIELKKTVSELKKRIERLEKGSKKLEKVTGVAKLPGAKVEESEAKRAWISAKGIKRLRTKMQLSQADFARLLGVSSQTVTNWESQEGKLNIRSAAMKAIIDVRGFGAKAARKKLAELDGATESPSPAAE